MKREFKYLTKRLTIPSGSTAKDYTMDFKDSNGYSHIESVAFVEQADGLSTANHNYKIGLKNTQGGNNIVEPPMPKQLLLSSGVSNTTNFLPFNERFFPLGLQAPADGISYTVTVTTISTLDEDLVLDVTFKLVQNL